jgi:hypothetical protein
MSEKFQNITQASDWVEWKKTCAYLNCSEDAKSRLGGFGVTRIRKWLSKISGMDKVFCQSDKEEQKLQAWQYLDTFIVEKNNRGGLKLKGAIEGKACKEWLFDQEGLRTVEDIERYLTNGFFRAAAQEYAKSNKVSPISLNQPISNSEESITWEEQLNDGAINISEELILKELAEFLREIVHDEFDSLKEKTKIAILGSALELSLDNDTIKELTDIEKSALYDRVKSANSKVLEKTKSHPHFHEYDVKDETLNLALNALLKKKSKEWGRNPENPASVLFDIA